MTQLEMFKNDMSDLKKEYDKVNDLYEKLKTVFGTYVFECEIFEVLYSSLEFSLKLVEGKYNDKSNWISWYIYENDWGKKEYEAGYDNNMKKICSVEDLYNIIIT
jgi:hypothetical protein